MLQTETQQDKCWPDGPRGLCADSTSASELLFASILDQIIVQNIPYEYFCRKGKSQLVIHELAQGAFFCRRNLASREKVMPSDIYGIHFHIRSNAGIMAGNEIK